MKRFIFLPLLWIFCVFLVSCSDKQMDVNPIAYEKSIHLVSGIFQSIDEADSAVFVTFLDDHGNEFVAEAGSLTEMPYDLNDGATYEIIYLTKSEDSEPTLYTDVIKIKPAEYDLNTINEDNEYIIP